MNGQEFYTIRKRLELTQDQFAIMLGYRGNRENNKALLERYELGSKEIPLTVATAAWLINEHFTLTGKLPDLPVWTRYRLVDNPGPGYPERAR